MTRLRRLHGLALLAGIALAAGVVATTRASGMPMFQYNDG